MHDLFSLFSPFTDLNNLGLSASFIMLFLAIVLWTLVLKGYALWYAARGGQKWWFIPLLVINTFGILEIVYLIWFRPKKDAEGEELVDSSSPSTQ